MSKDDSLCFAAREYNLLLYCGDYIVSKQLYFCQYLAPNVDCSKVTRPETKNIVFSTSLMASVLFAKHIGPLKMKGIASVPPNMVK